VVCGGLERVVSDWRREHTESLPQCPAHLLTLYVLHQLDTVVVVVEAEIAREEAVHVRNVLAGTLKKLGILDLISMSVLAVQFRAGDGAHPVAGLVNVSDSRRHGMKELCENVVEVGKGEEAAVRVGGGYSVHRAADLVRRVGTTVKYLIL